MILLSLDRQFLDLDAVAKRVNADLLGRAVLVDHGDEILKDAAAAGVGPERDDGVPRCHCRQVAKGGLHIADSEALRGAFALFLFILALNQLHLAQV